MTKYLSEVEWSGVKWNGMLMEWDGMMSKQIRDGTRQENKNGMA